jgi:dynein intermediate chain 2
MTDAFTYQKKREDFGRPPNFSDVDTKIIGFIDPDQKIRKQFTMQDPKELVLDNIPKLSEHGVNTERVATKNKGMKHVEGGWPEGIDPTEPTEVAKYKKKLDRDTTVGFGQAVRETSKVAIDCIRQNNEIDQFEEYFPGETPDHQSETITTKTLMLLKDPNPVKRAITKITWHPDQTELKLAACYSILRFQQMPKNMPLESYIWNLSNPNEPDVSLCPPSALCTIAFNHKNSDILVGGSYNGSLSFFDLREGTSDGKCYPTATTVLEKSHHDPVYDIYWLTHAKTGDELVSTSTDGRLLWWDRKKLSEPVDELIVNEIVGNNEEAKVLGCTRIEYNQEPSPMKYLAGTEQGYIFLANKKPGKAVEIIQRFGVASGKHHGPIYALQRNPFAPKYFMSIGDWTAKIWSEELKTPIMQTKYHDSYLTDGCWSPQRPGLFYLTRMDGFIDIWDFFYRQNEVAYSQKISDNPLTCISINGSRAAVGDSEGSVTLMTLCPSLYESQPSEKDEMIKIFDREAAREKNLELAKKQADTKKPTKSGKDDAEEKRRKELEKELLEIEEQFYKSVGIEGGEKIGAGHARDEDAKEDHDDEPHAESKEAKPQPNTEAMADTTPGAEAHANVDGDEGNADDE